MKKAILALAAVFCLVAAQPATAQTYYFKQYHPNEISLSYGVSLIGSLASGLADKINFLQWVVDDPEDYTLVSVGGSKGVINLGYQYQINKTISVGGAFGFNRMSVNLKDDTGTLTAFGVNLFTIMATAKFDWFRTSNDIFGMYSKAGLGAMCAQASIVEEEHLSGNLWLPTLHASLIGMEVGRGFSGFMELGVGMQGIFQAGVRARF